MIAAHHPGFGRKPRVQQAVCKHSVVRVVLGISHQLQRTLEVTRLQQAGNGRVNLRQHLHHGQALGDGLELWCPWNLDPSSCFCLLEFGLNPLLTQHLILGDGLAELLGFVDVALEVSHHALEDSPRLAVEVLVDPVTEVNGVLAAFALIQRVGSNRGFHILVHHGQLVKLFGRQIRCKCFDLGYGFAVALRQVRLPLRQIRRRIGQHLGKGIPAWVLNVVFCRQQTR